jgi:isovaleryl-CoA dehydrogenase
MVNPYEMPAEHLEAFQQAWRYGRDKLHPLMARMDDEDWYPEQLMRELARDGYLGITAPPELGGAGADLVTSGLIAEAFSYWNMNVAAIWGPHENLCLNNILRNANEEQKQRYVPRLTSGECVGALGLTEPGAGSDAIGGMRTTARRDGEDYVLDGGKTFISNGPIADLVLVYAKTAPEQGAKGISAFIVEKGMPGFSVAQKFRKMGWRGAPTGELVFDQCRVPAANRVGPENAGIGIVMSGLNIERSLVALCAVGEAQRCLDLAAAYAGQRKQFGRPIGEFQMIQAYLAEMYTELESARQLAYRVMWMCNDLEQGGGGRGDIHMLTAAAVLKAGQTSMMCAERALQIHGGSGFVWETEINRHYRNVKVNTIGAGTDEIRKLIIGGELMKKAG